MEIPLDEEDAQESQVEEESEGQDHPCQDGPRVPRASLVVFLNIPSREDSQDCTNQSWYGLMKVMVSGPSVMSQGLW